MARFAVVVSLSRALVLACISALAISVAQAQSLNVGDDTSTPIEGIGHDYIHMLSETVNPSNGSVSLRLQMPPVKGRGISLPFSINYNSNLTNAINPQLGITTWIPGGISGSWSYSVPSETNVVGSWLVNPEDGETCGYYSNFIFQDPAGGPHDLHIYWASATTGEGVSCQPAIGTTVPNGQDDFYEAAFSTPPYQIQVLDQESGTYYSIEDDGVWTLPEYIEDRNGNKITATNPVNPEGAFGFTDPLGRTAFSFNPGPPITVTSFGVSYGLTSTSVSENFNVSPTQIDAPSGSTACFPPGQATQTLSEIQSVALPDGQAFQFHYGGNPYGLLDEVDYPTGASVSYTWMLSSQPMEVASYAGYLVTSSGLGAPVSEVCDYQYKVPVVATRTVKLNGSPVLTQSFTYSTTWPGGTGIDWTSKTTTVNTTDVVLNKTFKTIYNYEGITVFAGPPTYSLTTSQIPVESKVVYYDWGATSPIRTVTKSWYDAYELACEVDTLSDGVTSSGKWYASYVTPNLVGDVKEYDYGQVSTTSCNTTYPTVPSAPASPLRETVTNYVGIPSPLYQRPTNGLASMYFYVPSAVVTENSSGQSVAETDYFYDQTPTSAVSAMGHDDTNFPAGSGIARGNLTTKTHKCFIGSTNCTNSVTTYTYDQTGQVTSMTDGCGNATCADMTGTNHTTNYSYSNSYTVLSGSSNVSYTPSGNTNAYLTQITDPLGHIEKFTYDFNNGQLTASQDQNDINASRAGTTYTYNDPFARPKLVNYPDGGQTQYAYNDSPYNASLTAPTPSITTTKAITSSLNEVSTTAFDGMGHIVETILSSDSPSATYTATTYAGTGEPYKVYNPTRCSAIITNCGETTWGFSTYTFDVLGRINQVVEQDGSTFSTSYPIQCSIVTDEAGVSRKMCFDGLGRLTNVWEAPSGLAYETIYAYDPLNDLVSVTQNGSNSSKARKRTFQYDSLSRLISATNPESGTLTYTYDADSNLSTKTAPSPNQPPTGAATVATTYTYDTLNRLTGKSYNDSYASNPATPAVTFGYDGSNLTCPTAIGDAGNNTSNAIGRRNALCFSAGNKSWTFDSMGRITSENDRFIGVVPPYSGTVYTNSGVPTIATNTPRLYYLNGDVSDLFYPQPNGPPGYQFSTTENGAGRVTTAGDDYYNVFWNGTYTPDGQLATALIGWQDGPPSYNGSPISNTYNNRLQPVLLSASTATGTPILNLTYSFNLGNGTSGSDNGNVIQIANGKDNNRTQNFTYDIFNRIQQAYTNGPNWGETYGPDATNPGTQPSSPGIDAWGNLTNRSGVIGKTYYESLNCAPANTANQLNTCFTYDAAGNVIQNGTTTYTYDAENRLISTGGESYLYDGDGQRIEKCTAGTTPGTCASNATGTFYWKLADGSTQAESDLGGNWTATYGLIRGQIVSRVDLPSNVVHYYFQDHLRSTSIVTDCCGNILNESDYYPYGGEIVISGGDSNRYKFTGKERDMESGLDNFGARYDSSSMGRFMTPDSPSYSNHKNPQSWNLYAFALNNPVTFRDADGHKIDCANNVAQCQADAAAATANAQAAARVTTQTTTTQHSFLGIFHWTTSETQIAITGDINSFRSLSTNAAKLADLVTSDKTVTVSYDQIARPSSWDTGFALHGGSQSYVNPLLAIIDPTRTPGAVYDQDAVDQHVPQANTGEEFAHEVLGHIWGDMFGGAPAGTRGNMRDSIAAEDAVRALDPTRGQKGLESHHNYNEMPPDPKPQ